MSLLAYYNTLNETLIPNCTYFNGNGYLHLPDIVWAYAGPVTIEYDIWLDETDAKESALFWFGYSSIGAHRFLAHHTWSDKTLYFDYTSTSTTGRISAPFGGKFGKRTTTRLESGGNLNTNRRIFLDGVQVAAGAGSSAANTALNALWIGYYFSSPHHYYWKGWLRNLKIWQGTTLVLDMPMQSDWLDYGPNNYTVAAYSGVSQPNNNNVRLDTK